jgi:hypothetical protein
MPSRKHSLELQQWLDQMINRPGGAEPLISEKPVGFSDDRVREFTEDETDNNRTFLEVSRELVDLKDELQVYRLSTGCTRKKY